MKNLQNVLLCLIWSKKKNQIGEGSHNQKYYT